MARGILGSLGTLSGPVGVNIVDWSRDCVWMPAGRLDVGRTNGLECRDSIIGRGASFTLDL